MDSFINFMIWTRYFWYFVAGLGIFLWAVGAFRNNDDEIDMSDGFVGCNTDGVRIYREIHDIEGNKVPVYKACDGRGIPILEVDDDWNVIHKASDRKLPN